jgi:hypothetical protein
MARRTTLVIRKVRTIGIANSLALVPKEIFFSSKKCGQGGQKICWAEIHTSSEGAVIA